MVRWSRIAVVLLACGMLVAPARAQAVVPPRSVVTGAIAYSQNFNVYQMNALGGNRHTLTSRGSGYRGIYYSAYSYSPDGKYLLLVRSDRGAGSLLLLNPNGSVLRTLARVPVYTDFAPTWALDSDRIVYIASEPQQRRPSRVSVDSVDLLGRTSFLWSYSSTGLCEDYTFDPAELLYDQQTAGDGHSPTVQWRVATHLAVYTGSCGGGTVYVANTRSHVSRLLNLRWTEASLSPPGRLAVTQVSRGGSHVLLTYAYPGAPVRSVAPGELPLWSRDGKFLYFVNRTPGMVLSLRNPARQAVTSRTYTSAIFRANGDGGHLLRLVSDDAYGFGPLSLTPDNRSLVFSRVDNLWRLWNHRLPNGSYTDAQLRQYGPRVSIQRFISGQTALTLALNAGRPAVQP